MKSSIAANDYEKQLQVEEKTEYGIFESRKQ